MSIAPITALVPVGAAPLGPVGPLGPGAAAAGASAGALAGQAAGGASFASQLAAGLGQVQQVQARADGLAVQAATGTLADPASYLVASTEASLATQLTVAVRDKALDAFNEIMRMQA